MCIIHFVSAYDDCCFHSGSAFWNRAIRCCQMSPTQIHHHLNVVV
eukprot:COSAG02_NODE_16632_length_1068_cov_1.276574_2_plen_44_part_01